jgi:hypothetical protein
LIFRRKLLEAIRAGQVDLAFRRWERARVRPGGRQRTAVGVLEVLAVEVVAALAIDDEQARRAGFRSRSELLRTLESRQGPIYRIELRYAGPDPRVELRERADLGDDEVRELAARLEGLDRSGRRGPWTRAVLELIRDRPAVRAPELAAFLGRDTQPFKRDVRKLKELGLTESLRIGYRLSPRGRTVLERLPNSSTRSVRSR